MVALISWQYLAVTPHDILADLLVTLRINTDIVLLSASFIALQVQNGHDQGGGKRGDNGSTSMGKRKGTNAQRGRQCRWQNAQP